MYTYIYIHMYTAHRVVRCSLQNKHPLRTTRSTKSIWLPAQSKLSYKKTFETNPTRCLFLPISIPHFQHTIHVWHK